MTSLLVFPGALLGRYAKKWHSPWGPGESYQIYPYLPQKKKDFPREFSKKGKLRSPK